MSLPDMSLPDPPPATPAQAASIVMEASNDPGWGMFVWLAMTIDADHGDLCVLRWNDVDFDAAVLTVRPGAGRVDGHTGEAGTGARREHRVALDARTVPLLRAYRAHCAAQAAILGIERRPDAYVFSLSPDGGTAPGLETITERYATTCAGLGWDPRFDRLPRYSPTDLVAAGVDIRTFNWRLQRGLSRIQRRPRA